MPYVILALLLTAALGGAAASAQANGAPDLNDLEMAHVAVTANDTDIAYAHLALALSSNPRVRAFAETMIRDHAAVTAGVVALAEQLGVTAQDNDVSRDMRATALRTIDELSGLRGEEFDRRYVENEAAYHAVVNGLVAEKFIPNIRNPQVKEAFKGALEIFLVHQRHAEDLAHELSHME